MDRADIYIISRNSNWKSSSVGKTLETDVYNNASNWKKFLRILLITFAIGFTTAGIVFFFAFNWNGLHRFIKLGLVESILLAVIILALLIKNSLVKNILFLAASLLVGALFAVFGQVYQTSATAFDFFLGWTSFVTIWVLVANFSFLWALFLYLANVTILLYFENYLFKVNQSDMLIALILFNSSWLLIFLLLSKKYEYFKIPNWLINIVFIAIETFATTGVVAGILEKFDQSALVLMILASIISVVGLIYAFTKKNLAFLAIVPFTYIITIATLLSKFLKEEWVFLIAGLFVTISVGYLIKYLLEIQKKWSDA